MLSIVLFVLSALKVSHEFYVHKASSIYGRTKDFVLYYKGNNFYKESDVEMLFTGTKNMVYIGMMFTGT